MTIIIHPDGRIEWHFYKKAYRKSRWRKVGQRLINGMLKNDSYGLIGVMK